MKKLIFIFCAFGLTFNSCSSDDSTDDTGDPDTVLLKSTTETYEDGVFVTNYTYSDNKLVGISYSGGDSEVFNYTNNLLTSIKEYIDGELDTEIELEYDSNNRLVTETYMYDFGPGEVNTYTYNADGTVTMLEAGVNTYIYTYDTLGNRIEEEDVNGNQDYVYTYDTKNNPFKNIHQSEVFELMGHSTYKNNVLTYVNTSGVSSDISDAYTSSYSYNNADYPTSSTITYVPGTDYEEDIFVELSYY